MKWIAKLLALQAKGDATGPPRKGESKGSSSSSSVKKVEEKKRHERRPSTNVMKQESADKKKEGEGADKGENLKFAPSN